jgi:hypothetical protein
MKILGQAKPDCVKQERTLLKTGLIQNPNISNVNPTPAQAIPFFPSFHHLSKVTTTDNSPFPRQTTWHFFSRTPI